MSKAEILAELEKLTKGERREIRVILAEMDGSQWADSDDPLEDGEKAILDARLRAYQNDPSSGHSWQEVEDRVRGALKK